LHNKPHRMSLVLLLAIIFPMLCQAETEQHKPLIFGFLPSRSIVTLLEHYQPLREYLNHELGQNVVSESAPTYSEFVKNTANRRYDFVLTAPHFALLAIDSGKYQAPVTYTNTLKADILISDKSNISDLKQLAGKKIAIPPDKAIISIAARHYLQKHGLSGKKSPFYIVTNSHNASIHALLAGQVDAAVASFNVTRQFTLQNAPLKKLATTPTLPGMAFLVASDLPEKTRQSFIKSLVGMNQTKHGSQALKKMGYPGYRHSRKNEFESARSFLQINN